MAGGNLFGRALSYVVNELLVEGLANKYARLPSFLPFPPVRARIYRARVSPLIWYGSSRRRFVIWSLG
jgi:hypothetical protein